jgi:hypothetical protein
VDGRLLTGGAKRGHTGVEGFLGDPQREVDVVAAATSFEADLGLPEPDARGAGQHPEGIAVRPPLDYRKVQRVRVETLRSLEVGDL